jgi:hypothetical protein
MMERLFGRKGRLSVHFCANKIYLDALCFTTPLSNSASRIYLWPEFPVESAPSTPSDC